MIVWVVFWKGLALWRASRLGQKWWFIVLLVLNTFGVLEIFYIYVFSKKQAALHKARRTSDVVADDHSKAHTTAASIFDNDEPVTDEKPEDQPTQAEEKKEEPTST